MKKINELIFIIDKSGSMSGLERDTIGGFNSLIEKQKKDGGDVLVSLVLFDDEVKNIYTRVDLMEVRELTSKDYVPSGCTAMLDAIGKTIDVISNTHKLLENYEQINNVLVVITTDGLENSSKEFTYEKVKQIIDKKKEEKWEFLFLGANIDSQVVATSMGIKRENAVNYNCDKEGIELNYKCINEAICSMKSDGYIDNNWRKKIDKDIETRKVK